MTKNNTATNLRKQAHKRVDTIMDTAQNTAQNIQDRKNKAVEQMYTRASKGRDNIDNYIRKNPKKSVLIAAGAGAVASTVVAATMSKKKETEA